MKNVILMTIDACRKDGFGWYGNSEGLTPFLDSLEAKAIKFTRAKAVGPYTQASFPGILSSSYFLDFGLQEHCPRERVLLSQVLKKAGIITVAIHSNPYLSDVFGWNRGWDLFVDFMDQKVTPHFPFIKGDRINRKAKVWLKSYKMSKSAKPFFMWVHYMDIHEPYIPGKKILEEMYPSLNLTEDEMYSLFEDPLLKRDVADPEKVDLLRKLYNAHYREVDGYIEQFFQNLEQLGLMENTTVIITTDHGDEFADHNSLSHDSTMYSELVDVPLIIYDTDRETLETCDALVSNLNIPPTVTHLFGVEPSDKWRGSSLLPISDVPNGGCWGECIHKEGEHYKDETGEVHYYQVGDLKVIYREKSGSWEMYDLAADPKELNNIESTAESASEMKKKVESEITQRRSK